MWILVCFYKFLLHIFQSFNDLKYIEMDRIVENVSWNCSWHLGPSRAYSHQAKAKAKAKKIKEPSEKIKV